MTVPYVVPPIIAQQTASVASFQSASMGTTVSGDSILVFVEMEATGAGAFTMAITDTVGNAYTQVGSYVNVDANRRLSVWLASNITGGATFKVTATPSSSARMALVVIELVGTYLANAVDHQSSATGTSVSPAGGSTVVTNSNELVFSVATSAAAGNITCAVPSGYTLGPQILSGTSNPVISTAYKLAAAGSENPTWTIVSAAWASLTVSLLSAVNPTVQLNNSTGSDTLASGAGPGTAKTGTAAATHTNTTVNITDAVDLSGVLLDGSAVLCVQSSSGRQFSRIANVSGTSGAWVVTTQDAYANTESGRSWAIGGTLASIGATHALNLWNDARAGWTLTLNADDSIGAAITGNCSGNLTQGQITIQGASEFIKITQTANANHFTSTGASNPTLWLIKQLEFLNSNGTKTNAIAFNMNAGVFNFQDCILGDPTNTNNLLSAVKSSAGTTQVKLVDCALFNTTGTALNSLVLVVASCDFQGCVTAISVASNSNLDISDTIFDTCTTAISESTAGLSTQQCFEHVVFYNCATAINISAFVMQQLVAINCIFDTCVTAWNAAGSQQFFQGSIDYNCYHNNTVNFIGMSAGAHDQVGVDPGFLNAGAHNFGVSGNLKNTGFPDATRNIGANQSATVNNSYIGAAQPASASGLNRAAYPSGVSPLG